VEMITPPENAKLTHLNAPTEETTTRHGTPIAHGEEKRVNTSTI